MDIVIRSYTKSVGRQLRCPHPTKEKLLQGLQQELQDLPAEYTASRESLTQQFGTPADTARELQLCVSEEEFDTWLRRKKIAIWLLGIAAVAALALAFWYVNWGIETMPAYSIETIY